MTNSRISLRKRLVILVGGGLFALLFAQYIATAFVLDERQEEMIDALLTEQLHYSMQLYHKSGEIPEINVPQLHFYSWPIGEPAANVPSAFQSYGPGNHEVYINGDEYHFIVHDENRLRFLLAYNAEQSEDQFTEILLVLGISFLLSIGIAITGIYWLSGRALNSLTQLSAAVRKNDSVSLASDNMELEVHALATTLDDYRARQELLLNREREFSGYLSHELRTPLSVIRGQAEMIQLEGNGPLQQRAGSIILQADRMRNLIEQLLQIARQHRALKRESIQLSPMINRIWEELRHESSSTTQLNNLIQPESTVMADSLLLGLILRNALANARLHADGALLTIKLSQHSLIIEDFKEPNPPTNTTLPVEEGEGLGLAILKRACTQLGWSCSATMLPTGFQLVMTFPASLP